MSLSLCSQNTCPAPWLSAGHPWRTPSVVTGHLLPIFLLFLPVGWCSLLHPYRSQWGTECPQGPGTSGGDADWPSRLPRRRRETRKKHLEAAAFRSGPCAHEWCTKTILCLIINSANSWTLQSLKLSAVWEPLILCWKQYKNRWQRVHQEINQQPGCQGFVDKSNMARLLTLRHAACWVGHF